MPKKIQKTDESHKPNTPPSINPSRELISSSEGIKGFSLRMLKKTGEQLKHSWKMHNTVTKKHPHEIPIENIAKKSIEQ